MEFTSGTTLKNSSEPFFDDDDYIEYDENGPYFDPYASCYEDNPDNLWGEDDEYEYWINECGQGHGYVGCLKNGSEECDFECPFSSELREPEITSLQMIERWVVGRLPWPLQAWRNLMISRPDGIYSDAEELYSCMASSHNIYSAPWDEYLRKIFYDEMPF